MLWWNGREHPHSTLVPESSSAKGPTKQPTHLIPREVALHAQHLGLRAGSSGCAAGKILEAFCSASINMYLSPRELPRQTTCCLLMSGTICSAHPFPTAPSVLLCRGSCTISSPYGGAATHLSVKDAPRESDKRQQLSCPGMIPFGNQSRGPGVLQSWHHTPSQPLAAGANCQGTNLLSLVPRNC